MEDKELWFEFFKLAPKTVVTTISDPKAVEKLLWDIGFESEEDIAQNPLKFEACVLVKLASEYADEALAEYNKRFK